MIGTINGTTSLDLETAAFVGGHMAILGNTGSGKSHTVRKVLEETHGRMVQIVFDVEDEFHTLRQAHPYVLAGGPHADMPLTDPAKICRLAIERNLSFVIQMNALDLEEQSQFIADFLKELMQVERASWKPVLIVIDEAHRYAPQSGSTAALKAINGLLARGRKRGFTALLATQRASKINKNALNEVTNWLIGRTSPLDRRRAAEMLGFTPRAAEVQGLSTLAPGQFWGFGPALSSTPALISVERAKTSHLSLGGGNWTPTPLPNAQIASLRVRAGRNWSWLGWPLFIGTLVGLAILLVTHPMWCFVLLATVMLGMKAADSLLPHASQSQRRRWSRAARI